jgi:tetratricopeptide (TPR) repeat protein
LDALVDAHLLREATPGRYQLHDLVRGFAVQVLGGAETSQVQADARRRLLDLYLHTAVRVGRLLPHAAADQEIVTEPALRPDLVEVRAGGGADWFATERGNLRALCALAAETGMGPYAWQLAHACWRYLFECGYLDDLVSMHGHGLAAARESGDDQAEARMLNYLASAAYRSGNPGAAVGHLRAALAIHERLAEITVAHTIARANLAICYAMDGQLGRALVETTTVVRQREQLDDMDPLVMCDALGNLGLINVMCRRYDAAVRAHRRDLAIARQVGDLHQLGRALGQLGAARARLGQLRPAIRLLTVAVRIRSRTGNDAGHAESLNELGWALAGLGRGEESRQRHDEALAIMRAHGFRSAEIRALNVSGESLRLLGDVAAAVERHREALAGARQAGSRVGRARALAGLGACLAQTDPAAARGHYTEALHIYRDMDLPERDDVVAALNHLDAAQQDGARQ